MLTDTTCAFHLLILNTAVSQHVYSMAIELSSLTHCFTYVLLMFTTNPGRWALLGQRVVH